MIHEDFLLTNETSRRLFHEYAKDLPIIDYHNHLNPQEILEDYNYKNITELWLGSDHYKWRAMRANGIDEDLITGEAGDKEKFAAWAGTVPNMLGNPLYHWTHLELARFFNIDELLSPKNEGDIYEKANEIIRSGKLSARKILEDQKVEFVGTTDDPADSLDTHKKIRESGLEVTVSPSFRPDNGLAIEKSTFPDWLNKLSKVAGQNIDSFEGLTDALNARIDAFDELGCRSSDHGINEMFFRECSKEEATDIFSRRVQGEQPSQEETEKFKTYLLVWLGKKYAEKGWVMQLHIGPLRNNNTQMFQKAGPDSGFDSMGDAPVAEALSRFLDALEKTGELPKTVLYTLNPRDNIIMASMAGNFQNADIPGKVQFGTAWWFNDHYDGMFDQMKTLASTGLLKHFIGMLTDSRSMLSFTRHEYFRRILCEMLGKWAEKGHVPKDIDLLGEYVTSICYTNAKRYFNL